MNLACFALPLTLALAVGSAVPSAVPPSPPAPPPVLPFKPAPSLPGRGRTFVVPAPHGGYSMINIPRCYFVFGLQSRAGQTEFTDRAGRVLALPSQCKSLAIAGKPPVPR